MRVMVGGCKIKKEGGGSVEKDRGWRGCEEHHKSRKATKGKLRKTLDNS